MSSGNHTGRSFCGRRNFTRPSISIRVSRKWVNCHLWVEPILKICSLLVLNRAQQADMSLHQKHQWQVNDSRRALCQSNHCYLKKKVSLYNSMAAFTTRVLSQTPLLHQHGTGSVTFNVPYFEGFGALNKNKLVLNPSSWFPAQKKSRFFMPSVFCIIVFYVLSLIVGPCLCCNYRTNARR